MKSISLKETFNKKSIHSLKDIASACKIKGYTKMRKEELVDACAEAVQEKGYFEELSFILSPEAWEFYKKVAASDNGLKCNTNRIKYVLAEKLGFLHVEKCKEGYWFVVPDEIKMIYNTLINEDFSEVKEFADLIHQYAQAAVNLYGVISQEELVKIFNSQNEQQTDIDINFDVFMKHIYLDSDYCLWEEYVVHEDLEEDDFESVKELLHDTENKPRYVPEKTELLRYADWNYYENTKQLIDLSKFLLNKCGVSNAHINEIMFELHWAFAEEFSVQNYFDVLESYNVSVSEHQLKELMPLMMECCNNTRIWANKGHTPNEILKLHTMPKFQAFKIGRNEPCPCGSGKKYKKCCGRE